MLRLISAAFGQQRMGTAQRVPFLRPGIPWILMML